MIRMISFPANLGLLTMAVLSVWPAWGGARSAVTPPPGDLAMIVAASTGNLPALKRLFEHGLDLDHHDFTGNTPLIYAARYARVEMVNYLLRHGADVNAASHWGTTALKEAVRKGSLPVMQALLKAGADVDQMDIHHETPLFDAVRYRRLWAVDMLLERHARVAIRNDQGRTPLTYAVEQHQPRILVRLRQRLASPRASPAIDMARLSGAGREGALIPSVSAAP
jgi:ankyrin repeat protein